MKTNTLTKLAKGLILSAALITSVVACGNQNKNNQNLNAFQQSCTNCQNISGLPFFSVNSSLVSMWNTRVASLSLQFSGQNTSNSQQYGSGSGTGYNPYASPAMQYSGQVSAIGTASVSSVLNLGFCPQLPAGTYQIATQTVGTWNQGQISGLRLVGSGPVTFTMVLSNTQAMDYSYNGYSSSSSYNRLWGNAMIEQVNGYYCQGANFYIY